MKKITGFIKKEIVLVVAGIIAVITMFIVPPSKEYINYIDFKVLALLFSLMIIVEALRGLGIFTKLIVMLTSKIKSSRMLEMILVFICFFSSMIITNDVALITFVPFAIELLVVIKKEKHIIYIVVLQTIAANLGSMLTPIGNPQNIFLYNCYNMSMGSFFAITYKYVLAAMLLLVACVFVLPNHNVEIEKKETAELSLKRWNLLVLIAVFLVCIACVSRVVDYRIMLGITIAAIAIVDFRLFKRADYMLLLTFVAFFIITGNIRSIGAVSAKLSAVVTGNEFFTGILASQVISNVPAAVLLSNFTTNGELLLASVNIGGLGTLIASMASLISFRYYGDLKAAKKGKYIGIFTLMNLLFLAVMTGIFFITERFL